MGVKGSYCDLDKVTIMTTLKANNGMLSYAADDLKVCRLTLRRRIKDDPELVAYLADLRADYVERKLDRAERRIDKCVELDDKPDIALRAAIYNLNNLGRSRNYAHPEASAMEAKCMFDLAMQTGVNVKEADEPNNQPQTT